LKTRFSAVLVVLLVALAAFATAAIASSAHGKIRKFTHDGNAGRLTVVTGKTKHVYRTNSKTNCGVSFGQSGDQIPCKTLGKSKYHNKPVHITWKGDGKGHRIASLVAVDLSGQ
jgi:hypothetical protein